MEILKSFTSVYSYTTPEVKRVIADLMQRYPPDLIDEGWMNEENYLLNFQKYPFSAILTIRDNQVLGLSDFEYRYPTYGSDHAICEYLTHLRVNENVTMIFVLENDYEGFTERAHSRGIKVIPLGIDTDPKLIAPHVWFLSNPSARDGNILRGGFIARLLNAGHRVVYDLAYLGTTNEYQFDLTHPGIDAAFVSMSKPYGLFSHRIGFAFLRRPVSSLIANGLWFKNILGLMLAYNVLVTLDHKKYAAKYKEQQRRIVLNLAKESGLPLRISDAFLLAHINSEDAADLSPETHLLLEKYKRGSGYRFCLTPFFAEKS